MHARTHPENKRHKRSIVGGDSGAGTPWHVVLVRLQGAEKCVVRDSTHNNHTHRGRRRKGEGEREAKRKVQGEIHTTRKKKRVCVCGGGGGGSKDTDRSHQGLDPGADVFRPLVQLALAQAESGQHFLRLVEEQASLLATCGVRSRRSGARRTEEGKKDKKKAWRREERH